MAHISHPLKQQQRPYKQINAEKMTFLHFVTITLLAIE